MAETGRGFEGTGSPCRVVDVHGHRGDRVEEFSAADWLPSVDVSESDREISVQAELPGLDPRDIDVNVSGNLLTIKGEKKAMEDHSDENYFRRERYSGLFQRSVHLPSDVIGEEARARFQNGVLSIKLPKAESGGARKIDIP
jgi:HSP20 family protein